MTEHQPVGLTPVQWVATRATLPEDLKPMIDSARDPGALVGALLAEGKGVEAVRCVAGALPAREGVWWAWVSARHTARLKYGDGLPPLLKLALDSVEKWINAPSDDTRRGAWSAGDALGIDTPTGAAAAAIFLSGGSIAPAGVPETPPPPGIAGSLVSTSVTLAVATGAPDDLASLFDAYVRQGLAVIQELGGWDVAISRTWETLDAQQREHARASVPPDATGGGTPPVGASSSTGAGGGTP